MKKFLRRLCIAFCKTLDELFDELDRGKFW
jgi:hypothetical protein